MIRQVLGFYFVKSEVREKGTMLTWRGRIEGVEDELFVCRLVYGEMSDKNLLDLTVSALVDLACYDEAVDRANHQKYNIAKGAASTDGSASG